MKVQFGTEALIEYEEAAQYAEDRFGCGLQFVAAMRAALDSIAKDPTRFQPVGQDIRIFRLKRYPYYLFYRYDATATTNLTRRSRCMRWHVIRDSRATGEPDYQSNQRPSFGARAQGARWSSQGASPNYRAPTRSCPSRSTRIMTANLRHTPLAEQDHLSQPAMAGGVFI